MKNAVQTISEILLVTALIVLFAIPVIIYKSGIPTTTESTTNNQHEPQQVLGEQVSSQRYLTELMSTGQNGIQIEELEKTPSSYKLQVLMGAGESELKENALIRIVNPTQKVQHVVFTLLSQTGLHQDNSTKLAIDNTVIGLNDMLQENKFKPTVQIEPYEWVTLKVITEQPEIAPATFVIDAEFLE